MLLSKVLVNPQFDGKWVLITSVWHMPRSVGIFCKTGWDVILYPVDFHIELGHLLWINWGFASHLKNFVITVKEWVGLRAYRLAGKSC